MYMCLTRRQMTIGHIPASVYSVSLWLKRLLDCNPTRMFTMDDAHTLAPTFIKLDESPLDSGREIAQQDVGCGMHVQHRRDEIQQRRRAGKFSPGEVSVSGELTMLLVPANPDPVVESLQGKMNVFVCLEFQHGQPAINRARQ